MATTPVMYWKAFVNVPINDKAAVRLVGWSRGDAGYIDNVRGTRTMPGLRQHHGG